MWSWCGQLRWCHPLINWSEHDTHSHCLYNNLMIVIFSCWYLQSSHILMTGPGPPSPVFPHSCLLLPLSPRSTHRLLLPSQPKLAGDRSVVRLCVTRFNFNEFKLNTFNSGSADRSNVQAQCQPYMGDVAASVVLTQLSPDCEPQ